MIEKYDLLYIKPSIGGGGKGVIRIERAAIGYMLQTADKKLQFLRQSSVWTYLQKLIPPKRRYLVQQGLHLLHVDDRPVDFRVILLKPDQHGDWEYKGIMGKCAAKDSHVTNRSSGGSSILFEDALKQGLNYDDEQCAETENTFRELSLNIAHTLSDFFVNVNQLGLDLAIDQEERIWLIEANTRPNYQLFRDHEEPEMFAHIRGMIRKLRSPRPKRKKRIVRLKKNNTRKRLS